MLERIRADDPERIQIGRAEDLIVAQPGAPLRDSRARSAAAHVEAPREFE